MTTLFIAWMLLSIVVFVAIIAWTVWPANARRLEAHAAIPLNDDGDGP